MLLVSGKAIVLLLLVALQRRSALAVPPLVYPFGGTLKLLMGHALPIAMPGRILSFGQNLQFQFPLPQNASFFSDLFATRQSGRTDTRRRRRRQSDLVQERAIFYQLLEHHVQRRGAPGKECLKRSICESAETPLDDQGLVGEILQVLLTPDYGDSLQGGLAQEYLAAAATARRGEDCQQAYKCPKGHGLLDHITRLLD